MPCLVFGAPKVKMDLWYSSVAGEGDPAFKPAPMPTARRSLAAVLRSDGKVSALGGVDTSVSPAQYLASHETYHPDANMWTLSGAMPQPRASHGAARLPDGRLMVFGGFGGSNYPTNALPTIFMDSNGVWTETGPQMVNPRSAMAYARLENGKVFATLGENNGAQVQTSEVFDPNSNTWSVVAAFPVYYIDAAGAPMPGNRAAILGGYSASASYAQTNYVYEYASNTYVLKASMPTARSRLTAVSVPEGVFAIGGIVSGGLTPANERYDPMTDAWETRWPKPVLGVQFAGGAPLPEGKVAIFGGSDSTVGNKVYVYWP